jgi:hypothetical protein
MAKVKIRHVFYYRKGVEAVYEMKGIVKVPEHANVEYFTRIMNINGDSVTLCFRERVN